jgi:SAM-dependent methyltransferase
MPKKAAVLDLGCGTGRDSRALIDAGFDVTAVDGSAEMAREAETRVGRPVRVLLFEDLDYEHAFDGIWANASLLHVPRAALADVLLRVYRALKPGGLLFASFKSGGKEGRDKLGRYYNYLTKDEVTDFMHGAGSWTAIDLTEGRSKGFDGVEVGFVEVFARKTPGVVRSDPR